MSYHCRHYCIPECSVQTKCTSVSESVDVDSETVEPETRALMGWIRNNPFVLTVNLQGGSQVAAYPSLGNVNTLSFNLPYNLCTFTSLPPSLIFLNIWNDLENCLNQKWSFHLAILLLCLFTIYVLFTYSIDMNILRKSSRDVMYNWCILFH